MALETNQFVHPRTDHPYCYNGFETQKVSFKAHTKSYFCFLKVMKLCLPSAQAKATVVFVGVGAGVMLSISLFCFGYTDTCIA